VAKIPDEKIDEVLRATDIVDVVDRYLDLKQSGKNLKALCPFHSEDTPSFTVNPEDQFFYCFGCKEGGSAIDFVMEMDGLGFVEAIERLAERGGVSLDGRSDEGAGSGSGADTKKQTYRVNRWAMSFFQKQLWTTDPGEEARSYLKERNLNREIVTGWNLGFAPDGWNHLLDKAREKGLDPDLLQTAGLIGASDKGSGYYDRFRNRLMFPIFDYRDRVVGFGGRCMPGADDDAPKYLNTPETPVFQKRELLYGWNRCERGQVRERGVWVAEGYTDVLMAHQQGLNNVTATLGTALGEKHVERLRKRADRVLLLFDSDEAGREASDRSLRLFFEEDTSVQVGVLPEGEDPCSLLADGDTDPLLDVVEDAPDLIDYRIESARKRHDLSTIDGRMSAARSVLETVRGVDNTMRKQLIVKRIAELIDVDEMAVRRALRKMERNRSRGGEDASSRTRDSSRTAVERASRHLVGALVLHPEHAGDIRDELAPDDIPIGACRELFADIVEAMDARSEEDGPLKLGSYLASLDDEEQKDLLLDIAREMEQMPSARVDQMVREEISYIKRWKEKDQLTSLKNELREAYDEGDQKRYRELLDEVSSLQRSIE